MQIEMIPGKYYILDPFRDGGPGPIDGPFDTKEQAEAERLQINIADDCVTRRYVGPNPR